MDKSFISVKISGDSMWPSLLDGDIIEFSTITNQVIKLNDIIVFNHPLKREVICVKRVKQISENRYFVQGDNPDPTSSEDSHNFGLIDRKNIFAILQNE
ncbi:MAG: S26 family signal peptidase [Candidatus Poseidoniaceae archaeon]